MKGDVNVGIIVIISTVGDDMSEMISMNVSDKISQRRSGASGGNPGNPLPLPLERVERLRAERIRAPHSCR